MEKWVASPSGRRAKFIIANSFAGHWQKGSRASNRIGDSTIGDISSIHQRSGLQSYHNLRWSELSVRRRCSQIRSRHLQARTADTWWVDQDQLWDILLIRFRFRHLLWSPDDQQGVRRHSSQKGSAGGWSDDRSSWSDVPTFQVSNLEIEWNCWGEERMEPKR